MSSRFSGEAGAMPWSPLRSGEFILDGLTLGWARLARRRRTLLLYADLDEYRLEYGSGSSHEVVPHLLPDLNPDAITAAIAHLSLEVAQTAEVVHINTFQGYIGTSTRKEGGRRVTWSSYGGSLHLPTLYRAREATGRDYAHDWRNGHALIALVTRGNSTTDIEGMGMIANEYRDGHSRTGRITDLDFLIRGLAPHTAEQLISSLRGNPAETLDGVIYTAFASTDLPGRSLLQTPLAEQPPASIMIPGVCTEVMVYER